MSNQHPAKEFFNRAKNLEEEIAERREDLKALYAEVKRHNEPFTRDNAEWVDIPALRGAVKRALESDKQATKRRAKEAAIAELLEALGEFAESELGKAARARAAA